MESYEFSSNILIEAFLIITLGNFICFCN